MSRAECAEMLRSTGLPVVYDRWPDGSTPVFPCIRYIGDGQTVLRADMTGYVKQDDWAAFIVSEHKDDESERLLEAVFDAAGIDYAKLPDVHIDSEGLHQVEYDFSTRH